MACVGQHLILYALYAVVNAVDGSLLKQLLNQNLGILSDASCSLLHNLRALMEQSYEFLEILIVLLETKSDILKRGEDVVVFVYIITGMLADLFYILNLLGDPRMIRSNGLYLIQILSRSDGLAAYRRMTEETIGHDL